MKRQPNIARFLLRSCPHARRSVRPRPRVVLVPVGDARLRDDLGQGIRAAWLPWGVEWEVSQAPAFADMSWDSDGDGRLMCDSTSAFAAYSEEMRALNTAYTAVHGLDSTAVYLFVLKEAKSYSGQLLGDMPVGYQFGYVFARGPEDRRIKTAAHELGHGRFQLRHTFVPPLEIADTTDNLMSYHPTGTTLCKRQWDYLHDPQWRVFRFLQGEEEGRIDISTDFYVTSHNPPLNGLFLTPAGMPFYLEGVTKTFTLKEYDETTSSVYLGLNTEALYGFAIAGEKPGQNWRADIPDGWFTGYLLREGPATHYQSSATQAHIGCQQPIQLWDIETLTFSEVEIQASDWFTPPSEWNLWQGEGPLKSSAMRPVIDNTQTLYTLVSEQNMHESSGKEMSEEEWNRTVDMLAAKLDDMISKSEFFDLPGEYTQVETGSLTYQLDHFVPQGASEEYNLRVIAFGMEKLPNLKECERFVREVALQSDKYSPASEIVLLLFYTKTSSITINCNGTSGVISEHFVEYGVFGHTRASLSDKTFHDFPSAIAHIADDLVYYEELDLPPLTSKSIIYVVINTDETAMSDEQVSQLAANLNMAMSLSDLSPYYTIQIVETLPCEYGSLDVCVEIGLPKALVNKYTAAVAAFTSDDLGKTFPCEQSNCPPCFVLIDNQYVTDNYSPHLAWLAYTALHEALHRIWYYATGNLGIHTDDFYNLLYSGIYPSHLRSYPEVLSISEAGFLSFIPYRHFVISRMFYLKKHK